MKTVSCSNDEQSVFMNERRQHWWRCMKQNKWYSESREIWSNYFVVPFSGHKHHRALRLWTVFDRTSYTLISCIKMSFLAALSTEQEETAFLVSMPVMSKPVIKQLNANRRSSPSQSQNKRSRSHHHRDPTRVDRCRAGFTIAVSWQNPFYKFRVRRGALFDRAVWKQHRLCCLIDGDCKHVRNHSLMIRKPVLNGLVLSFS